MPISLRHSRGLLLLAWTALASLTALVLGDTNEGTDTPVAVKESRTGRLQPVRVASERLPNLVQLHARVYSGGLPADDDAFRELQARGFRTIISVDGAKPDAVTARRWGLRYIHLPHGYDGIAAERVRELAKALQTADPDGLIYIHCHHGKHRSPAAASAACIAAGWITSVHGKATLDVAGTSPDYPGLFAAVESARPIDAAQLAALQVEFHETVALPPLAEAMVAVERLHDQIKHRSDKAWRLSDSPSDSGPLADVVLLREAFTELLRDPSLARESSDYRRLMSEAEQLTQQLEDQVRVWWEADPRGNPPVASLEQAVQRVSYNCRACHQAFRNQPQRKHPQ